MRILRCQSLARAHLPRTLPMFRAARLCQGHNPDLRAQMMDALARVVFENPHGLMACDLSNLLRSFAVLGMLPFAERSAMYTILIRSAIMRLHDFTPLELANVTWALACLDPPDDILGNDDVRLISARAEEMFQPSSTDVALLCQLHQWQLWLQERGDTSHGLSCSLRASALEAFSATVPTTSHLQMLVGMDLAGIAQVTRVEEEVVLPNGYRIDFVVEHAQAGSINIEVDGPSHFLANGSRKPTGATQLKRRQLRRLGFNLVSLPYWDIDVQWDFAIDSFGTGRDVSTVTQSPGVLGGPSMREGCRDTRVERCERSLRRRRHLELVLHSAAIEQRLEVGG